MRLHQYKRLSFGISSDEEVFQYIISSLINDILGTRNISDDTIICGRNKVSHNNSLHAVLRRLHGTGLTINLSKCKFPVPEIHLFSHKISSKGLAPDPKTVKTLKFLTLPFIYR